MDSERTHPPSEQRLRDAQKAGLGPRPWLLGFSACACLLTAGLELKGPWLTAGVRELLVRALLSAGSTADVSGPLLSSALRLALEAMFGVLSAGLLVTLGLAWWLGGASCGWPQRRQHFSSVRLAQPWPLLGLFALSLAVLVGAGVHAAVRVAPSSVAASALVWSSRGAIVLGLLAVLDAVLARSAFRRSLWMTRGEARAEERAEHGAPEARKQRAAARQHLLEGEP